MIDAIHPDQIPREGPFVWDGSKVSERAEARRATRIMEYWQLRGHDNVRAWVYYDRRQSMVTLRSNLDWRPSPALKGTGPIRPVSGAVSRAPREARPLWGALRSFALIQSHCLVQWMLALDIWEPAGTQFFP